ncbi:hypothetical protein CONCODRAFT_124345 [Conidiobolus coronatus NRRL 28638]|uniref:Uncharacterized protein n=1 Tax=Conidiobolus coronatus (strain ATCC 28846 / CBS 209.66 / NRRL 28638) TaxID=796925 RepID=A0A137NVI1_CONC2|nr:hypothetical protein CONCODRAFT_124345 [Conidiobolus coronatus NRRL 28638]|eukprot:KXN66757.1 hypothetical protein CONCODRAFT_124345 [Conidiobolus coronatus NRRL 28638]
MGDYTEEFKLLFPGELKSLKFNDSNNSFNIASNEHYSIGTNLSIEEVNGARYLKHETGFICYKDGVLTTTTHMDKNTVVYLKSKKDTDYPFKLKCKDGYFDKDLKVCSGSEEAYNFQLLWSDLVNPEDLEDFDNSSDTNSDIEYISTDGLNLTSNENSLFTLILNRELISHANFFDDDNSLMFSEENSDDIKFQFKNIKDKIHVYSPEHGYFCVLKGEDYYDHGPGDYVGFSEEIPQSAVTLSKTNELGTYKLVNGSQFVKVLNPEEFPNCVFVDSADDASDFQFVLVNEEYEFEV